MTPKQFDEYILDYREYVFLFLKKRFSFSNEIIEDIIQDAFIKAYVYLQNNKLTKSTFKTWICKVAFNTALDSLRRKRYKKLVIESDFNDKDFADNFIDIQADDCIDLCDRVTNIISNQQILDEVFGKLKIKHPDFYKTFMVYLDVDNYQMTSEIEDIPIGTVKSRICKARKFIQDNISEDDLLLLN